MAKFISSNLEDLLTREAKEQMDEFMISDINYFAQNSKAQKVTLEYAGNKVIVIERMESGSVHLQLTVDGRDLEVVPQ